MLETLYTWMLGCWGLSTLWRSVLTVANAFVCVFVWLNKPLTVNPLLGCFVCVFVWLNKTRQ